jgi:hypothetical protein
MIDAIENSFLHEKYLQLAQASSTRPAKVCGSSERQHPIGEYDALFAQALLESRTIR